MAAITREAQCFHYNDQLTSKQQGSFYSNNYSTGVKICSKCVISIKSVFVFFGLFFVIDLFPLFIYVTYCICLCIWEMKAFS